MGGRAAAEAVIERARVAGFAGLVVTIDTPVSGIRERDYRNGMKELISGSLLEKIPFLPQVLSRPGWLTSFLLDGGLPALPNVVIPGKGPMPLVDINAALASSAVTWADLRWICDLWRGPIAIRGVLTGDDARRAIDEVVAGIARAIEILRADLERTLKLLGCPSITALDRSYVNVPKSWDWS